MTAFATYSGPKRQAALLGLTFYAGQERPVPADVVEELMAHPLFSVRVDDPAASAPVKKRTRTRKAS